MATPVDISPAIIEALYQEALGLADEARHAFDDPDRFAARTFDSDATRIALSCEALRTTTRMMHVIAWLLNHRAFHRHEMSELALRRTGRLPPAQPESDPAQLAVLDPSRRELVRRTRRFYARVERLDCAWHDFYAMQPSAVHRLRERIGASLQSR